MKENSRSHIKNETVRNIKRRAENGEGVVTIAANLGLHKSTVSLIVNGKRRADVKI